MKHIINEFVQKVWYQKTFIRFLFWPLSLIYFFIITLRKKLYTWGINKTIFFDCPVIVIGNITVGGTGKTPLVIALAQDLKKKGLNPGIITRGYKGQIRKPELVFANNDPEKFGDEPLVLARRTNCPVVVCPDRIKAVRFLLENTACNVILSDDGLQHYALGRSIEIAVIDGMLEFGNDMLLPAGPLREPVKRLKSVDFCVINHSDKQQKMQNIANKNIFYMHFVSEEIINIKHHNKISLNELSKVKNIHAVAAIGNPKRFFNALKEQQITCIEHAFLDHHSFSREDFAFLQENECVIMTEKDAVKCEKFADDRFWYMPIEAKLPEDFYNAIMR